MSTLFDIIKEERLQDLVDALASGADPNTAKEGSGLSLLHAAAMAGSPAMVKALLDAGAEPNALSRGSFPPLSGATNFGRTCYEDQLAAKQDRHLETVELLLAAGADPNRFGDDVDSPLIRAIPSGMPMIERLLEAGARVDSDALLAEVMSSNRQYQVELVELIMAQLGEVDASSLLELVFDSYTDEAQRLQLLTTLLDTGLDINHSDPAGVTLLHRAVASRSLRQVAALLGRGASLDAALTSRAHLGEEEYDEGTTPRGVVDQMIRVVHEYGDEDPELLELAKLCGATATPDAAGSGFEDWPRQEYRHGTYSGNWYAQGGMVAATGPVKLLGENEGDDAAFVGRLMSFVGDLDSSFFDTWNASGSARLFRSRDRAIVAVMSLGREEDEYGDAPSETPTFAWRTEGETFELVASRTWADRRVAELLNMTWPDRGEFVEVDVYWGE